MTDAKPLAEATVSGDVYLGVTPTTGIKQVVWYFDNIHWWTGGAVYGLVKFAPGQHTVRVRVTPTRGTRYTLEATFTVPAVVVAPKTIKPETFGAKGDGIADDAAALQQALDSLVAGDILEFTNGRVYKHSTELRVKTAGVILTGAATLLASAEARSSLMILAPDVTVSYLTLNVETTTKRWDAPEQMKLYVGNAADRAQIRWVAVKGSAAAGIFIAGASGFLVSDCSVQDTRADGIHITGGANNGQVINPSVRNPGDDGVAIVSYKGDGAVCHHITVTSPDLYAQQWGRAFSVVGGQDITWRDLYADTSGCAAVYIAAEAEWNTYGCQRITVDGGRLVNSNSVATVDHGAVLLYNSQPADQNVDIVIKNLTVKDTRMTTSRQLGLVQYNGGTSTHVTMENITIEGGNKWLYSGNAPASATRRIGWTWNGVAVPDALGWS